MKILKITGLMFAAGFIIQPLGSIAIAGDNDLNEPAAQKPAIYSAARKMAMLHVGGEKLSPQIKKVMYDQTLESYNKLPDFQALEAEFPGVTVAVVDAVVPVAVRQTENSMPAYIDKLADLYSRNMTMNEISQMTQWFQSSVFGRLQNSMESNFDLRPIISATAEDEEYQISERDLNRMTVGSAIKSVRKLSKEDKAEIAALAKKDSFKKFRALRPQAVKIEAEWSNQSTPEEDAELEKTVLNALEEYTKLDLSEAE